MSDASAKRPQLALQKIFLKDASLETPMGVKAFQQTWKPKLNQELQTRHTLIEGDLYEVVLTTTLTASLGESEKEQVVFIVEVQQAGIFQINAANEDAKKKLINAVCPGILFPYAREALDGLIVKAGFPAVSIPPINFDALYQQALQQQALQQQQTKTAAH